ncbi:MAG: class I SAM-dependent methyltransferase [Acidimicrobiales bacterium]
MTDPYDIVWSAQREHLAAAACTDAEWYASVARSLCPSTDRLALDVGCGGAGMAVALAAALPPDARVVALDGDDEILATAKDNVEAAGVPAGRVDLRQCDLHGGLDALRASVPGRADIIWASAVVHHVGDQQAAIDDLARLLAPGGRLALAEGGLHSRHLPWDVGTGEPGLELRLDAAEDRWFARMRSKLPGNVPMPYGWTEALGRAGLVDVTTWSSLLEQPAPLAEPDRDRVIDGLRHRVDRVRETGIVPAADLATWGQLLDPADGGLSRRTDLFSLRVRSVHVGTAGGA